MQAAVTTGGAASACSQLDLQFLRNILRFDPIAASLSEFMDCAFQGNLAAIDNRNIAAEKLDLDKQVRI